MKNEITIKVGLSHFVFSRGDKSVELRTILYLDAKGLVVGVGTDTSGTAVRRIDLFKEGYSDPSDRGSALISFLRFGFSELMKGIVFVRPTVRFENLDELKPILHGYEPWLLALMAFESGARVVEITKAGKTQIVRKNKNGHFSIPEFFF